MIAGRGFETLGPPAAGVVIPCGSSSDLKRKLYIDDPDNVIRLIIKPGGLTAGHVFRLRI